LITSGAKDGQCVVVNARSQEFSAPLGYRLILRRAGDMVQVTRPSTKSLGTAQPLADPVLVDLCYSRFDYMGMVMTHEGVPVSTALFDGMNAAGLSVGGLNAPSSQYQASNGETQEVFAGFFADWLLANYATCWEVKNAFSQDLLRVVATSGGSDPIGNAKAVQRHVHIHFAVHDTSGNSLVIEFIDGKAVVTDNPIGVLTNLPVFSWHLTNLGLYAYLSNMSTHNAVKFGPVSYGPPGSFTPEPESLAAPYRSAGIPGMGDGLAGIPGDFRPASRFVRTAYMKKFAVPPETATEAVTQAFHLLNGVDIVKGASAEEGHDGSLEYDTTQCIMVKDLTNRVFYVRMYDSPMPYSISFAEFATFAPPHRENSKQGVQIAIPSAPLATPLRVEDVYRGMVQQ
jgi:choloylglycine hydrolase